MNRNALHQSSPLQPVMAVEGPNWWAINKMRPQNPSPPPPPQHSSFLAHPNLIPQSPLSTWIDNQELPADQSWSQLLMGGTTSEEDKTVLRQMQQGAKKLDIWEEELLEQEAASNGCNFTDHLKQENLTNNYISKPSSWSMHPVSSPTSCITNMLDFSNIKAHGRHPPPVRSSECNSTGNGGVAKKARLQPSSSTQSSTFKVRKEKLGDRITALHQLVSPFGKTDTASVLLEALGYIRFLQSQIEALSLPYLGSGSGNNSRQQHSESIEEVKKDLSSKGLCLVPISCTVQVGSDNGADYWAAAASGGGY